MKKFLITFLTLIVAVVSAFSFTACEKIGKLEFVISVYDADEAKMVDKTLTYNVHYSLAPNATAKIKELVKDGYFNDCVFYKQSTSNGTSTTSQLFFGGLNRKNGEITQNTSVTIPDADFKYNGTEGSNLTNSVGYIGLWKTWNTKKSYSTSGQETTYSTMYMPTSSLSSYDGYFCVFAKYSSSEDLDLIKDIAKLFDTEDYVTEYTCYYSANDDGELIDKDGNVLEIDEATGMLKNGEPVWNIVSSDIYNESKPDDVYENEDYKQYNEYTITVLNADKLVIKEIKIK